MLIKYHGVELQVEGIYVKETGYTDERFDITEIRFKGKDVYGMFEHLEERIKVQNEWVTISCLEAISNICIEELDIEVKKGL